MLGKTRLLGLDTIQPPISYDTCYFPRREPKHTKIFYEDIISIFECGRLIVPFLCKSENKYLTLRFDFAFSR